MAENLGIADSFAAGQDYAIKKQQVDVQKEQLLQQQRQMKATADAAKIEQGLKLLDDWKEVYSGTPGPLQKSQIMKLKTAYNMIGMPWDPEMEAGAQDDRGRSTFAKAYANFSSLSPDQQGEVAMNAIGAFGQEKGYKALETMAAFNAESVKEVEKAEIAEKGASKEQGNKDRTFVSAERELLKKSKEFQQYSETGLLVRNLLDSTRKRSPFRDMATIFNFMKLLDPNSVVRESEGQLFINTGSAYQRVANTLTKMYTGQSLGNDQRKELLSIGRRMIADNQLRYMSAAESSLKDLEAQGFKRERVDPATPIIERDRKFLQKLDRDFGFRSTDEEKEVSGGAPPAPKFSPKAIAIVKRIRAAAKGDKAKAEKAYGQAIDNALWKQAE